MLADLEQKWGMTLLERSKSGVRLTSAGEPVRPFLLLEHSGKAEVSDLLERAHVQSDIHFTAWGILPSRRWWKGVSASASCQA